MDIQVIPIRGDIFFRPTGESMLLLDYDSRRDGSRARVEFLDQMALLSVGGQTYVLEDLASPEHVRMEMSSQLVVAELNGECTPVLVYTAEIL